GRPLRRPRAPVPAELRSARVPQRRGPARSEERRARQQRSGHALRGARRDGGRIEPEAGPERAHPTGRASVPQDTSRTDIRAPEIPIVWFFILWVRIGLHENSDRGRGGVYRGAF